MSKPLIDPPLAQATGLATLIAVKQIDPLRRETPSHSHARGQLLGALRGLLTVGTDRGQHLVAATQAIWIPPHHTHSVRSHGPFMGWSVYVDKSACATLPVQPCTLRMSALLHAAVDRAAAWSDTSLDEAQARIVAVVLDEIRSLPRESFELPMPRDARLLRIAQAIADDPADNRGLPEWADWAHVPSRTLTRRFSVETGFSFTQWRQRARLLRALELLARGTAVTTTALDLGYENVSAFIAMFRRSFGVTPGRYLSPAASG